ncbi:MAG: nucleotidyltransferase family protein [Bacteroidetes bacterium]|nr:nucleotidyltransferase family protein [Bacteroidota bacterium]
MITAIVLAAGESRRMGSANKLLLPFGETTLIERMVRSVRQSEADEVIVVLGHEADRVRAALDAHDVAFVENDRYQEGMTTSIHAGVRAASPEAAGFMICLSDLPLIEPEELNRLIEAFKEAARDDERPIVVPTFEGRRGNPVLFPVHYKTHLLDHKGLMGCKAILKQNPDTVLEVAMATDHVLRDIDTMEAYQRLF